MRDGWFAPVYLSSCMYMREVIMASLLRVLTHGYLWLQNTTVKGPSDARYTGNSDEIVGRSVASLWFEAHHLGAIERHAVVPW